MGDHTPTNTNVVVTEEDAESITLPEKYSYDTELILRTYDGAQGYSGKLYGKFDYRLRQYEVDKYNITAVVVIASYYKPVVLEKQGGAICAMSGGSTYWY